MYVGLGAIGLLATMGLAYAMFTSWHAQQVLMCMHVQADRRLMWACSLPPAVTPPTSTTTTTTLPEELQVGVMP